MMSSTSVTNESAALASLQAIPKVRIYGVPISKMSMKQTVDYLTKVIELKQPHQVITANPIMVMAAQDDPAYLSMMQRAELIVPDGTGVVWAAEYVGEPVVETGSRL